MRHSMRGSQDESAYPAQRSPPRALREITRLNIGQTLVSPEFDRGQTPTPFSRQDASRCVHTIYRCLMANMPLAPPSTNLPGPAIRAFDPWLSGNSGPGEMKQLLSDAERAQLASIASVVRLPKGAEIYHAGDTADAVFDVAGGVIKAHRTGADGSRDRRHVKIIDHSAFEKLAADPY
jgi:hypothetical protein